jgi:hypothetical protein
MKSKYRISDRLQKYNPENAEMRIMNIKETK